ncbi:MAG: TSUP family transporter [Deltaproteobacteria bacterium]|nr:TSUP family transporter [Deltaproteobacteria bacterium]MBI4224582.1 TSUP family transporter [Deltaproteobacteria bacterium]
MFNADLLFLAPVIFVAGFIDSIAGGGGLLTVPAYLIAGIPPTQTLGTNKFVSTVGTFVSTGRYVLNKRVLWPVALVGVPFSLAAAAAGANFVAIIPDALVAKIIIVALPVAAAFTLIPKPKGHREIPIRWKSLRLYTIIPLITVTLGGYDGMFGPGTGSLLLLCLYGVARLNFLHAAATARFFNLLSNLAALVAFLSHGAVLFGIGIPLALFSMGGHYLGSHLALKHGDRLVRIMLAVALTLLLSYLLWKYTG